MTWKPFKATSSWRTSLNGTIFSIDSTKASLTRYVQHPAATAAFEGLGELLWRHRALRSFMTKFGERFLGKTVDNCTAAS